MLKKLNKNDFDKLFILLESSFPKDEYRTYEQQKELFGIPEYCPYAVYDSEQELTAIIVVWEFESLYYIEHFAVNEKYRSRGIGAKMLEELRQKTDKMICLEVEPPTNEKACRRIKFYERNGFFLNDYNYIQPALSKGRNPLPLLIMTTKGKVDESTFNDIRDILYKNVYKNVSFEFRQCGTHFIKDGKMYKLQTKDLCKQAKKAAINFKPVSSEINK